MSDEIKNENTTEPVAKTEISTNEVKTEPTSVEDSGFVKPKIQTEPVSTLENIKTPAVNNEVKTISTKNSNVAKPDVSESYIEAKQENPTAQPDEPLKTEPESALTPSPDETIQPIKTILSNTQTTPTIENQIDKQKLEKLTSQIPINDPISSETKPLVPEAKILGVKTEEVSPVSETVVKTEPEIVFPSQQTKPVSETAPPEEKTQVPEPTLQREVSSSVSIIFQTRNKAIELLVKARSAIQTRKRKKLDKVMTMFVKKDKITNDEVEKLLHVSDSTATRYLSQLEKEGKIKQNGKTGKGVFYTKI